jgi:hypothetical protein
MASKLRYQSIALRLMFTRQQQRGMFILDILCVSYSLFGAALAQV